MEKSENNGSWNKGENMDQILQEKNWYGVLYNKKWRIIKIVLQRRQNSNTKEFLPKF